MRISGIHIENFLSFRCFTWRDLDPHLNLIVGPNGAGKTNLINALRVVVAALTYDKRPAEVRGLMHRGLTDRPFKIALDVEFSGDWEGDVLRAFVAAVLCDERTLQSSQAPNRPRDREAMVRLSALAQEKVDLESVSCLRSGRLVVACDGPGRWSSWYESLPNAPRFRLAIEEPISTGSMLYGREQTSDAPSWSLFQAWRGSLGDPQRQALDAFLDGAPDEPPQFDLDVVLERYASGIPLKLDWAVPAWQFTHRALERLVGTGLRGGQTYDARFLFLRVLQHALVFTDNVRAVPVQEFRVEEFDRENIELNSGRDLALALFLKKNGDREAHEQYRCIQDTFRSLTGRSFDVGLGAVATQEQAGKGDAGKLVSLEPRVSGPWGDVPLEFSGAGIAEALLLSTLISGEPDRVILLDEPATNLHPTVQRSLLDEVGASDKSQFVVVTHSPALVDPEAVARISRFHLLDGATDRAAVDPGSWDRRTIAALQKELRGSADSRALLFCRGAILVEGETELGALPVWYRKYTGRDIGKGDVVLYAVGSDKGFERMIRYLEGFGVPWAIICDGPVVGGAGKPCRIAEQMRRAGTEEPPEISLQEDFQARRASLAKYGVFTLAASEADEIEDLAAIRDHLDEARKVFPRSGVLAARYIAETRPCAPEVAGVLDGIMAHLTNGTRRR